MGFDLLINYTKNPFYQMILHTEADTKVEMHMIQGIIGQEGNSFPLSGTI